MITFTDFNNFIINYKNFSKAVGRIEEAIAGRTDGYYACDLAETDWYKSVDNMLDIFLNSHFKESGIDLIYWWLFEPVDHIITEKVDPDLFNGEKEVEYDINEIEDLWKYMETYKSEYINE